jgi:putative FmdB family regulatory protein
LPIYEYECRACGHCFEQLVRAGTTTPACPACQSEDLIRLLSGFAVSSETMRESALQSARRKVAQSRERRDKLHAEAEHTLEHLREDYGVNPTKTKPTP